ncbi:protein HESO1-like [Zingiber officinale]|uniref:protein HESO1-like n=1 Tax=Zingiber officinale TaxID=94328 RepID=UPI001C4D6539|nr:protein HESO1-like [Zingiber officinale]XP_042455796.1 protein HESO1-like [Zingiber officinale]
MAVYHSSSTNNDRVGVLEICLKDILVEIKPVESHRVERINAIRQLEECLRGLLVFRGVVVSLKPFGSFVSNLYTKWGDLDVSVQIDNTPPNSISRNTKRYYLKHILHALRRTGLARNTQYIPNARVPLLKYISRHHNISFDVSINNHFGVMKSSILKWLSEIDDRFRDMVLVTKEWAKAQNINDAKSGTLNSYSLCLLVIFHFQTCDPPILPPLRVICEGSISNQEWSSFSERHVEDVCSANIQRFRSRRRINKSSLAQLLVSFFDKLSGIGNSASEYSISTFEGRLESITSGLRSPLIIEDPFERSENAARTVRALELHKISNAFRDAHDKLSSSLVLSDRDSLIFLLTRPILASRLRDQQPVTNYNTRSQHSNFATIGVLERQFENTVRLDRMHSQASTSVASIRPSYRNF